MHDNETIIRPGGPYWDSNLQIYMIEVSLNKPLIFQLAI